MISTVLAATAPPSVRPAKRSVSIPRSQYSHSRGSVLGERRRPSKPVPASACSGRACRTPGTSSMCSSISSGMPSSRSSDAPGVACSGGRPAASTARHFGSAREQALVDAQREAGRARDLRELVEHLTDALGRGSVRWNARPSRPGSCAMCSSAAATQSTGTMLVRRGRAPPAAPTRAAVAHPLDRLEEVVRAVDLVHLAGVRVADDDRWAVHAPRHVGLLAHDALGLELRAVVGRGQPLALIEHLLGEDAG